MDSQPLVSPGRRFPSWVAPALLAVVVAGGFLASGHWAALTAGLAACIRYLREAGPVLFFLGMALLPAAGFPLLPFTLAAGPVFGPTLGPATVIGCAILAVMINVTLSYWLAAQALRPFLARLIARFGYRLPVVTAVGAWQITTLARLAPGLPFWGQSYLLGLVRVPFAAYFVMSTLIPGAYLTAIILGGDALWEGRARPFLVAAGLLGAVGALAHLVRRHQSQRAAKAAIAKAAFDAQLYPPDAAPESSPAASRPHPPVPARPAAAVPVKSATTEAPPRLTACRVRFGGATSALREESGQPVLTVALPLLAGVPAEDLLEGKAEAVTAHGCTLFSAGPALAGFVVAETDRDLEEATGILYRRLFAATAGKHLYRIWNYVPQINATVAGLENYRRFCRGRSLAFEEHFGAGFQERLPAASAVGSRAGPLAIGFLAGDAPPQYFENPLQIPAFEYPSEYGPRSPSFSRATVVDLGWGRRVFVSGTAAIRGHATVAVENLERQLACTVENLCRIGKDTGAGPNLGATGWHRRFKVYVRHAEDLPRVKASLEAGLLLGSDVVSYVQADICRADLLVEIEAVLAEIT